MASETVNQTAAKPQFRKLPEECEVVREDFQTLIEDLGTSLGKYYTKRPQMAALMLFAVGFYVGWKVKPW